MKHILIILATCLCLFSSAQDGFKYIQKAEQSFEKGNLKKANKFLTKADKAPYGFCGNAWLDANFAIAKIRSKMFYSQGAYQSAICELDSIVWWNSSTETDSILACSYRELLGGNFIQDSLEHYLKSIKKKTNNGDFDFNQYLMIPISSHNITVRVKIPHKRPIIVALDPADQNKCDIILFKELPFYRILTSN
ncbi:MAG: hypothetical protein JKY54_17330 [Flavobacteriales bacterium]|nr:hypothetical protein [Flavobacteriales bacterium]